MKNILVIEDNDSDITILKFLLNKLGYNAVFHKDPYAGVEQLKHMVFHMILLDWQLPHLSGIELLKSLKMSEDFKTIPVVMMSGRNELKDVKNALLQGALDYVIKPIDPLILQNKIEKVLSHQDNWKMIDLSQVKTTNFPKEGEVQLKLELVGISEVGVEFFGPASLECSQNYDLNFKLLKDLGIVNIPVRVLKSTTDLQTGRMRYSGTFIGLKEGELKKLRVYLREISSQTADYVKPAV